MSNSRWQKIDEIFPLVADLPAAERDAALRRLCAGDEDLRREIALMLKADEQVEQFIETPVMLPASLLRVFPGANENETKNFLTHELHGQKIGAYRVVRKLGAGGMGAVYLAERADGSFRKQAAIKLVKNGADTGFNLRRFRHERQILAALEHPNIARLLDGGKTDAGTPYFVMEYVEGKQLFDFCAARELDLRARLQLFRQICAAVDYAHANGIVHRDLKPGNILVADDGVVKLLDFGIAKILDPELIHDSIENTATMFRQMTPEYASPEQICGEEITPASDVYSLGVVLFELLTGERPYKFTSRAPHEIARVICEEQISIPQTGAGSALSDDLKCVILRSLAKKPAERYDSVAALDIDIEKTLAGQPVWFRNAPNTSHIVAPSTGKAIQTRQKFKVGAVVFAAACSVLTLAGVYFVTNSNRLAEKSPAQNESPQASAAPVILPQNSKPRTADAVADGLYLAGKQQMSTRAADGLNKSIELFKQAVERDPNFALAFSGLSDAYVLLGDRKMKEPAEAYRLAEENAVKALTLDPDLVEARISLAMTRYRRANAVEEAERHFLRAIELDPRQPTARHWYSVVLLETGRSEDALREILVAAEIEPRSAIIQVHLSGCYLRLYRYDEALDHADRAIQLESRLAVAYVNKSLVLQYRGDYEAARENFRQLQIVTNGDENDPFWLIMQAHAHAASKRRAEGLAVLNRLFKTPLYVSQSSKLAPDVALFYHLLGDDEKTFEWLKKVQIKKMVEYNGLVSDPRFAKLRDDPRFHELEEKWKKQITAPTSGA